MSDTFNNVKSITGKEGVPGTVSPSAVINQSLLLNNTVRGNASMVSTNDIPTAILQIPMFVDRDDIKTSAFITVNILAESRHHNKSAFGSTTIGVSYRPERGVSLIGDCDYVVDLTADEPFPVTVEWAVVAQNVVLVVRGIPEDPIEWACDYSYFMI